MEAKKIIAGATIGLIAGGVAGFYVAPQHVVEKVVYQNQTIEVPHNVTVEVPYNVTVEVPVDNGNLDVVLQNIYDNKGNVTYLIDDLKDDEVDQIADRVILVNEFKKFAVDAVQSDLINEIDKTVVNGSTLRRNDIKRLRIDSDFDEIKIKDIDFDDKDATTIVTGTFEQSYVKYNYTATIVFKDDAFYEFDGVSISQN